MWEVTRAGLNSVLVAGLGQAPSQFSFSLYIAFPPPARLFSPPKRFFRNSVNPRWVLFKVLFQRMTGWDPLTVRPPEAAASPTGKPTRPACSLEDQPVWLVSGLQSPLTVISLADVSPKASVPGL